MKKTFKIQVTTGKVHKNAGMFSSIAHLFTGEKTLLVRRGQIVGLLKDCLQSLLGIVEEEKKETKSGIKSWPFSWA